MTTPLLLGREQLEARESATLAPYAIPSTHSGGREYPEAESERRTAFQRDRDRVLHTSAFRRLEHKTQVFLNVQGDHYRTRLTHTLEVQQVARSLALILGLNETLAETVALAHDLGHPPYGHAGEKILDELLAAHGGFNHNLQAVRIVRLLEQRYAAFPGLNLTRATLDGLNKHHRAGLGRPSLEAQLVDAADALAYTAHDLDDGLRSGLLRPEQLRELSLWQELAGQRAEKLEGHWRPEHMGRLERHILHRELLGYLMNDLATQSAHNIAASGVGLPTEVAQAAPLIGYSPHMHAHLAQTRAFLYANLYEHWQVERQREQAQEVLTRLYTRFVQRPQLLPPSVRVQGQVVGLERAACDYLAGMTDRYALDTYAQMTPPVAGRGW